jgi:hypothetical protein
MFGIVTCDTFQSQEPICYVLRGNSFEDLNKMCESWGGELKIGWQVLQAERQTWGSEEAGVSEWVSRNLCKVCKAWWGNPGWESRWWGSGVIFHWQRACIAVVNMLNHDSSANTLTTLWTGWPIFYSQKVEGFFLPHYVQTSSQAYPASYSVSAGLLSLREEWSMCETEHSPPYSAELRMHEAFPPLFNVSSWHVG